ncbi:hypothetical protein EX30DRAFT_340872 [Ascodesmis nigricans]|uniref:Uncharacterized protein n=1 Tax=Ascodesmis nigricans TaxID=341454 RepID=A0A4S2MX81_9PEZI|nr:hypothetical protein EX30DRAFT_340872 [Ascodesmis nigricans]
MAHTDSSYDYHSAPQPPMALPSIMRPMRSSHAPKIFGQPPRQIQNPPKHVNWHPNTYQLPQ